MHASNPNSSIRMISLQNNKSKFVGVYSWICCVFWSFSLLAPDTCIVNGFTSTTTLVSRTEGEFVTSHVPYFYLASTAADETDGTTSLEYALNPDTDEARELVMNKLGISDKSKYTKLKALAELIVSWNERLNLISRKDCTVDVVFGRHILPSIALTGVQGWDKEGDTCSLFGLGDGDENTDSIERLQVVDIGTGGGFPGLPLAIIHPNIDFTLVDSVGKKLKAIEEMADELSLDNVSTYHGRAEEMIDLNPKMFQNKFDVCVGRSVAALPKFCFWINGLLKKDQGKLLYIIGGELEDIVQDNALSDVEISQILGDSNQKYSDKRALLFSEADVNDIAMASGERKQKRSAPGTGKNRKKSNIERKSDKLVKGAWTKRDNSAPKQRGAENFRRFTVN